MDFTSKGSRGAVGEEQKESGVPQESRSDTTPEATNATTTGTSSPVPSPAPGQQSSNDDQEGVTDPVATTLPDEKRGAQQQNLAPQVPDVLARTAFVSHSSPPTVAEKANPEEHETTPLVPAASSTTFSSEIQAPKVEPSDEERVIVHVPPVTFSSQEMSLIQLADNSTEEQRNASNISIPPPIELQQVDMKEEDEIPSERKHAQGDEPSEKVSSFESAPIKDKLIKQEETTANTTMQQSPVQSASKKRSRSPTDDQLSAKDYVQKRMRDPEDSGIAKGPSIKREETNSIKREETDKVIKYPPDAKKRPRSPLEPKLSTNDQAKKKLCSLQGIAAIDTLIEREDAAHILTTIAATPLVAISSSADPVEAASRREDSSNSISSQDQDQQQNIAASEKNEKSLSGKKIHLHDSSRQQVPSNQERMDGQGIFDDADEDESFDISTLKKASPAPPAATSLRPDLIAAILGSAPKTILAPHPQVVPPTVVSIAETKLPKKTRPLKKTYKGKKEQESTNSLLSGKIDLMEVLPERDCRFLAEKMWIVSLQQLETILHAKQGKAASFRNELIEAIMSSDFLKEDNSCRDSSEIASSNNEKDEAANAEEGEHVVVKSETSSVNDSSSLPPDAKLAATTASETASSNNKIDKAASAEEEEEQAVVKSEASPVNDSSSPDAKLAAAAATRIDVNDSPSEKSTPKNDASRQDYDESTDVAEKATAESSSPEVAVKSSPGPAVHEPSPDKSGTTSREAAERLLELWSGKVRNRDPSNDRLGTRNQFLLDGPLSCLIPRCTLNFFASANIQTAMDFLSLRRTETGLVVDMYALWRKKCGLVGGTAGTIAKHFLAVGMRLELAIGSFPAPGKEDREWFGGPLAMLSGQAKDFLFDYCKIFDSSFIKRRTKDMADMLSDWRDTKDLEPLRGTGKVAMISSWKTLVKDAMDLEKGDGRVLENADLLKTVERDPSESVGPPSTQAGTKASVAKKVQPETPGTPPEVKPGPLVPALSPKMQAALESKEFLASVLVKKETTNVLASVGITTAQKLLDADKGLTSPIVNAIIKMRRDFSGVPSGSCEPSSCVRLVYEWCRRVKKELAEIEEGQKPKKQTEKSVELGSKKSVEKTKKTETKKFANPIEALSGMARKFLGSINIQDAEGFLAAKTKYLADAFGKYREDNDMPILKGLGTVASISGWKAIVRKAAEESGQGELVTLNAGRNAGKKLKRRRRKEETSVDQPEHGPQAMPPETPQAKPPAAPEDKPQPTPLAKAVKSSSRQALQEVNIGGPKRNFCVDSGKDTFFFELTSRKCSYDKSMASTYLTYLGNMNAKVSNKALPASSLFERHHTKTRILPVSEDTKETFSIVPTEKKPFCSQESGLIEVGRYGVVSSSRKEALLAIQRVLKTFIFQGDCSQPHDAGVPWNVFERRVEGGKKSFLYIAHPMEKGQTVELRFLPAAPEALFGQDLDAGQRSWIEENINTLHATDLRGLIDFLEYDIGKSVYADVSKTFKRKKKDSEETQVDSKYVADLAVARRRMHWVALRIISALQKEIKTNVFPAVALKPLWQEKVMEDMRGHPVWSKDVQPFLLSECKNELMAESLSGNFGGFWTSQEMWCPMADRLFRETVHLISNFSLGLEDYWSEERLVVDLRTLISQAVANLLKCSGVHDQAALAEISLRCKGDTSHSSNVFPTTGYLKARLNQGYRDAMVLCGEPEFELEAKDEWFFLATEGRDSSAPDFRSLDDARAAEAKIDIIWYVRTQILAVVESAALCGVANIAVEGMSMLKDLREKLLDSAREALGGKEITPFSLVRRAAKHVEEKVAVPDILFNSTATVDYKPNTEPIFLCIVWPVLKQAKWKLEAGELPSSVTYSPPGKKKDTSRTRMLKQEAAIQRGKFARKTAELGLGYIPKQAKKMFVNCAAMDEGYNERSTATTVSEALRAFEQSFDSNNLDTKNSIKKIVEHIATLFETAAPALLYDTETEDFVLEEGALWRDSLHCDHLMRLLLILPKMLNHSDVSLQQVENTTGVVTELINFLVENRQQMFASSFQLPREEYEMNHEFPKFIVSRLGEAKEKNGNGNSKNKPMSANLKEIVLPSDRNDLTDFVNTVMDQMIACKATSEDIRGKGRRSFLTMGMPGLVCRHCLGSTGEGKYFYSNVASLSTTATSADKHIARCPLVSSEIKERMAAARGTHGEQKSNIRPGAQTAFYARLWDRLQLSKTEAGAEADMYVMLDTTPALGSDQNFQNSDRSNDGTEFRNHIEVLEYIQSTSPWKSNSELTAAMESYYRCVTWGGSMFNTADMPQHFSSEWILAKLGHGQSHAMPQRGGAG